MKKFFAIALVLVLMLGILTGCSKEDVEAVEEILKVEELAVEDVTGSWVTLKPDTQEEAVALLENIEAYAEELALADLDSLEYAKVAVFNADGTYSFGYDVEGTKACVRAFFDGYFKALYAGRTTLNELYSETFDDMTEEAFCQCFAEIYGRENYEVMLDSFTETAYNYEALEEPTETGTFRVENNQLLCTITGETAEESLGAEVADGVLTLTYVDGVETYTKK